MGSQYIVDIVRVEKLDLECMGRKAYEFGELKYLGIPIPEGFVIKTSFFDEFLKLTGIDKEIEKTRKLYHPSLEDSSEKLSEPIKRKILHTHLPYELASELHKNFTKLSGIFKEASVNIFTSPKNGESKANSNISGDANLVLKIKEIWASHLENPVAIVITKNMRSDIKGKMLTSAPTFDKRLTEEQMDKLTKYCKLIQEHFYFPKEIEYILIKDKIYITQIAPFTGTINTKNRKILVKGTSVKPGIVTGSVKVLNKLYYNTNIKNGEIIITQSLDAQMYKNMTKARAIVVDSDLPNSLTKTFHSKILHIPIVFDTKNATKIVKNGNIITVNGTTGEIYSGGLL